MKTEKRFRQKTEAEWEAALPNDPRYDCPCSHWHHLECVTCKGACSCHWIEVENTKIKGD